MIVDDDRLAALSLRTIVEAQGIEVLGVGHSGQEAIEIYDALRPNVLLMDIRMEGKTGLEAAEEILEVHPKARILFLTTFADDAYIISALRLGAMGYILKQEFENITSALHAVNSGQMVFGEGIAAKLPHLMRAPDGQGLDDFDLTPKEKEIVALVAEGMNNREIAARLYLSEGRVRNALSVVLEKLQLRDRTQLAIFYHQLRQR